MIWLVFVLGALCIQRPEFKASIGKYVREALTRSGLSVKAAALTMGMDHAQLSRQLDGDGHLSITRLMALPPSFWRWFAVELAVHVGTPRELRATQRLRMARASLRQQTHKEQKHA